jgi:hypothetical protein
VLRKEIVKGLGTYTNYTPKKLPFFKIVSCTFCIKKEERWYNSPDQHCEHHKDNKFTRNQHKPPLNNPNHTTRPKGLTGNDGACRPPPSGPHKRATSCPAKWRHRKSAYVERGSPRHGGHRHRCPWGPYSIVKEATKVVNISHDA